MAELAVIRRLRSGFSNMSLVSSPVSLPPSSMVSSGLRCILLMRRRATGPPMRPPATRPKVAQAMPMSVALARPIFSRSGPQPAAVPCPPVMVMEPATRPSSGFWSSATASPTPTAFWTAIKTPTTMVKMTSGMPPAFRREKSALRPMEEKNTSMKASRSDLSKAKLTWLKR